MTSMLSSNGQAPAVDAGAVEDVRARARRAWVESANDGTPLSGTELGRRFDRSPAWGRQVAAEARQAASTRQAPASTPPRAPVAPATPVVAVPPERQPGRHWADSAIVLAVAVVAAAASYGHMLHVAVMAGEPLWLARAFPITVDGLTLAALRRGEQGRRWLALALAVSVAANVLAQFPEQAAAAGPIVSAWPPLALYGTHRLLHVRR